MKQTCQKCALAALTTALQMSFLAALYLQPREEPLTWRCEGECCLQAQQRLRITCPCPLPCARAGGDRARCLRPNSTGGSSQTEIRGQLQGVSGIL